MVSFTIAVALFLFLYFWLSLFGVEASIDPQGRPGLLGLWNGPLRHPRRAVRLSAPIAAGAALCGLLSRYSVAETAACALFIVYAAVMVLPDKDRVETDSVGSMVWRVLLLAAAASYAFSPWPIDQKLLVAAVVPFIIGLAVGLSRFVGSWIVRRALRFLGFLLAPLLRVLRGSIYRHSGGALVLRPPRLRGADFNPTLCERCKKAVCASALLFGSWLMFAQTDEQIPLHATLEEMQRSWRGCQLCEALLNRKTDDGETLETLDESAQTASQPVYLTLKYRMDSEPSFSTTVDVGAGPGFGRLLKSRRDNSEASFSMSLHVETRLEFRELAVSDSASLAPPLDHGVGLTNSLQGLHPTTRTGAAGEATSPPPTRAPTASPRGIAGA